MLEPEVAFAGLPEIVDLAEDYLKFIIRHVLQNMSEDLNFFD